MRLAMEGSEAKKGHTIGIRGVTVRGDSRIVFAGA
jgi:hypothetical protein